MPLVPNTVRQKEVGRMWIRRACGHMELIQCIDVSPFLIAIAQEQSCRNCRVKRSKRPKRVSMFWFTETFFEHSR